MVGPFAGIVRKLERLSLRQRFLVAPLLGLLLLGVLLAVSIYEAQRQNALLNSVADRHLEAIDRYSEAFVGVSAHHLALHDLLTKAARLDGETLRVSARGHLDAIRAAIAGIDGLLADDEGKGPKDADFLALQSRLPALSENYRLTMTRAVELAGVAPASAAANATVANERFVAMNGSFAKLLEMRRGTLAAEIDAAVGRSKAASALLTLTGMGGAILLLLLSLLLSRLLARTLEAQVDTLAQLGGVEPGPEDAAGDEVQRIGRAIASFRRTQTQLRESEHRFRSFFEHNHAVMLLIEPASGAILGANESAARFYGYTRAQLAAMNIEQLNLLPSPQLAAERQDALHERRNYFVFPHRLADGSTRIVEVHATPIETAGKALLFSIIHDITERRTAEAALQKSRQLNQSILDHSGTVIFVKDLEGRYLLVNQRFAELFGVAREAALGRTDFDILPAVTAEAVRAADRAALLAGSAVEFEEEVPNGDDLRTYLSVKFPLYDERGEPYAVCGIATDITERKRVETALRNSEAALNDAQAVARLGSWTLDIRTDALSWSAETYRIFGVPQGTSMTLESFFARIHPKDRDAVAHSWQAALRGQPYDIEHRIVVGDEIRWVRECAHIRFDGAGAFRSGVGTVQDVTELKRAQEALSELNRDLESRVAQRTAQLEAASRAKSDFLSNMSHEIRTPMNTVLGMAHLALRTQLDAKQRDYLEKIYASGEHLLGLIDAILDFSKIEAGRLEIEAVDFDLADVMNKVRSVCAPQVAVKGLRLDNDIDPAIPLRLRGDPLRLGQVLINFTNNAVKFTERGAISIGARLVEQKPDNCCLLRFEVSDTGIGMSAAEQAKLFGAFQQADTSTTRKYGGTGLGLAISKQLAALMGGEVGVASEPGRGSTFWCTVRLGIGAAPMLAECGTACRCWLTGRSAGGPGVPHETAAHPGGCIDAGAAALAAASATIRGARILVADDHPFNQQVAASLLEDVGATVCVAQNGAETLDLLLREHFDCVLMDIQMPEMDGIEATRRIRLNPGIAATPVIAMTANAWNQDRERCLAAGMDDFVSKPIQPELLYATLARRLAGRAAPAAQVQAAFAGDPAVIDLAVPAKMLRNDAAKIRRVALKFIESTRDDLPRLDAALSRGDLATLGALGHRIKSPARALGAVGLAELCQSLEAFRDGSADVDAEQAARLVGSVGPLLERIAREIERHPLLSDSA